MFDWILFLLLIAICVPGILVVVPRTVKMLRTTIEGRLKEGQSMPSHGTLVVASSLQSVVLVAIFAALGTWLAPRVGLEAPILSRLAAGEFPRALIQEQIAPVLLVSLAGAAVFLVVYYGVFRPWMDAENVRLMEGMRHQLGIGGRVLYGGVVEEVLSRWGLMTLLVWLGSLVAGEVTPRVMWVAIVVAGVLFGLGHLPSYLGAGCRPTPAFLSAMLFLNLWAALIFGWLFWQYGLLAAVAAHAIFHLAWWPFDLYFKPGEGPQPHPAR